MKRQGASLKKGSLVDYSSASRIMSLYGNDMAAIRAEYSRQRSIVRKRVERMAAAGETTNITFKKFGNVHEQLPTVRSLSDAQVLEMLTRTSRQLAGGYKATLSEIRQGRRDLQETIRQQAEDAGDEDLAQALDKPLTPSQWEKVVRLMGMVQKVNGKTWSSDIVLQSAMKVVLEGKRKESLLTKAARLLSDLGIDEDPSGKDALESVKEQFTAKGTTRVSWAKAHGKRGR